MSTTRICPRCGGSLPPGTRPWLCPTCLMIQAAQPADIEAPTAVETPSPSGEALPHQLGGFALLERIGQGGMGVVYKARQLSLDRVVAVKILCLGARVDPEALNRFHTEAETAASLQHPNIVAVHEVGFAEGQPLLVMDYVPGPTLADLVRNGPLPSQRAARYLRAIAEAVHYAHERGVLHRDLKPSNVLIDQDDQPRVTDFGLAKRLVESSLSTPCSQLTLSGQVLGSPAFIPPEQASGQRERIGRRSDVYALGAILYHLLTGRPPFTGEALTDILRQVVHEEPLRPRLLNPAVPPDIETVCLKCLEKEPAKRYGTAESLAEELGRFLAGKPVVARPIGLTGKAWRWCRRNPRLAVATGAALVILLFGMAGVSWQWRRAEAEALLARRNAYAADMNLVEQSLADLDLGRARDLLNRYRPAGESNIQGRKPEIDLAGWEWRYLWARCQSDERFTLHRFKNAIWALAFSPDAKWLAVRQEGGTVALWDTVGRRPVATLSGADPHTAYRALAFSPRGNVLAWGSREATGTNVVSLWDLDAQKETGRLPHSGLLVSLSFSPDARELATLAEDGTIRIWDVDARQVLTNFATKTLEGFLQAFLEVGRPADTTAEPAGLDSLAGSSPAVRSTNTTVHAGYILFSGDGRRLALGEGLPRIRLWDWATRQEEKPLWLPATVIGVTALAFSPDGGWLAAAGESERNDVYVWDLRTRAGRRFIGHRDAVLGLAFSPDGKTLASVACDTTLRLWDVVRGIEKRQFHGDTAEVWAVAWSPDGKDLVTGAADGSVRYWDPAAKPLASYEVLPEPVWPFGLAFLPDSRTFLTVNRTNGAVVRWDTATLQRLESLPFLGTNHLLMDLTSDGRWLAVGDKAGHVGVWDFPARRLAAKLVFPDVVSLILFFSPDARYLLCGGYGSDRDGGTDIRIWELGSWREVKIGAIRLQGSWNIAFSPGDSTLVVGSMNGTATWWDLVTGERRLPEFDCREPGVTCMEYSPDGKRFATAGGSGLILLWDAAPRPPTPVAFGYHNRLTDMCFSPDGARLATCGTNPDRLIRIWDVTIGRDVATLPGQFRWILRSRFSPDGHTLVAATLENVVQLWRAPSWEEIERTENSPRRP